MTPNTLFQGNTEMRLAVDRKRVAMIERDVRALMSERAELLHRIQRLEAQQ